MSDELAEIDGFKPNVVLKDNEETEVKSSSSKSVYKVKRTFDHYYCNCPAWRNQSGVPVNARTCKHLQSLLGEEYEAARLKLKNPDGPPPKGAKKPASKARKPAKGKKKDEDNEDEEDDNEEKKGPTSKTKGKARASAKRKKADEEQQEEEEEEDKPSPKGKGRAAANSKKAEDKTDVDDDAKDKSKKPVTKAQDELADFDGIRPKVMLGEGEEKEVRSENNKSVYKVKRTGDYYHCNCPAWRSNPKKINNIRTCKHLKSLLGEAYDEARIAAKKAQAAEVAQDGDVDSKPTSSKKAAQNTDSKPASSKNTKDTSKPGSKAGVDSKPQSKAKAAKPEPKVQSKGKGKRKREEEEEEEEEADDDAEEEKEDENDDKMDTAPDDDSDPMASINGVRPDTLLKDGEETEVDSKTSSSKYKVKRTFDHYYCTCPAWRNQGGVPVNARSCKHLVSLLGEKYEAARIKRVNPDGPQPGAKPRSSKRAKKDTSDKPDSTKGAPALLLANKWDLEKGVDPTGWWISEKLDGVRTYYDGKGMYSRLGNPFTPPKWFLDKLPKDVTLDGELFAGRGEFQSTVSIVKTMNSPHWKGITFQVFDIPSHGDKPFEKRVELIEELFGKGGKYETEEVVIVKQIKAKGRDHVLEKLKEIEELGGEGLMLRKPESVYEGHRSSTLLKVKTFYDAEAIVTGHEEGHGKNTGLCGALKCKMESGKTFKVGSGLTDKQRKDPPKTGSIITYRFQELTKDGVPRFPTFVGIAIDKKKPKDAVVKKGQSEDDG